MVTFLIWCVSVMLTWPAPVYVAAVTLVVGLCIERASRQQS